MTVPLGEWATQAACAGTPGDWWFPVTTSGMALGDVVPTEAAATCAACPVFDDCHRHALLEERYGVWAATSELARARLRRSAGIRISVPDDVVRAERARLLAENGTPPRTISGELGVTRRSVHRYLAATPSPSWWEPSGDR